MLMNVYAFWDSDAEAYHMPFCAETNGLAIRHFTMYLNDGKSIYSQFKDRFSLVRLGQFDNSTGVFSSPVSEPLGNGIQFADS